MNLDAQIARLVRDALETMLDERFDALEDRIAARVTAAVSVRSPLTLTACSSSRGSISRLVAMCRSSHDALHDISLHVVRS